jgi:putative two-component system response regulator
MRTHTTVGARLLSSSDSPLLERAATIALTHHERWDGAGYPGGLAGADIPLDGRIVAIADFYDALSHDRPYRQRLSHEEVVATIKGERGRHFDPDVHDAFMVVVETPDGDGLF